MFANMVSPYCPTNFFKIKILVTKAEHNQDVNKNNL